MMDVFVNAVTVVFLPFFAGFPNASKRFLDA